MRPSLSGFGCLVGYFIMGTEMKDGAFWQDKKEKL
jgi:hypothetical protein